MREDTVSALLRSLPEHMGAPAVLQYFDGAVRQRRRISPDLVHDASRARTRETLDRAGFAVYRTSCCARAC